MIEKCACHYKEYCPDKWHEEWEYDEEGIPVVYRVPIETWRQWEARRRIGAFI